jgi:hypothetical protein
MVEKAAAPADGRDLRHEFVGLMFAIAVGEVGLQVAPLVQEPFVVRYLPAYSHLSLALFVIAASWVGWSRTKVSAAKRDVEGLFEWPFLVLLLDTAMVVTYFVLVRTIDFSDGHCRIAPAAEVAWWHVVIFGLYLAWDGVTKVAMYPKPLGAGWFCGWRQVDATTLRAQKQTMKRAWPTLVCLVLSIVLWRMFAAFDPQHEHLLAADLALLSVVLLFRALKGVVPPPEKTDHALSTPEQKQKAEEEKARNAAEIARHWKWVWGLGVTLVIGTSLTVWSIPLPLWPSLADIRMPMTMTEGQCQQTGTSN